MNMQHQTDGQAGTLYSRYEPHCGAGVPKKRQHHKSTFKQSNGRECVYEANERASFDFTAPPHKENERLVAQCSNSQSAVFTAGQSNGARKRGSNGHSPSTHL